MEDSSQLGLTPVSSYTYIPTRAFTWYKNNKISLGENKNTELKGASDGFTLNSFSLKSVFLYFFPLSFRNLLVSAPPPKKKQQVLHGAGELSSCHQDMQAHAYFRAQQNNQSAEPTFSFFFGVYLADISTGPSWLDQGLLLNSTQSVSNLDLTTSATIPQSRYVFFQGEKSQPQEPWLFCGKLGLCHRCNRWVRFVADLLSATSFLCLFLSVLH